MLFFILCVFFLTLLFICNQLLNKKFAFADCLPGPIALPLIGSAYIFLNRNGVDYFLKTIQLISQYSSPMKFWLGSNLLIVFHEPDQAEKILSSTKVTHKHDIYDFMKPYVGNGMISGSGPKWKHARRLVQPLYNIQFVSECIQIFQKQTFIIVKALEDKIGQPTFNVEPIIHKFSADVIGESILGTQLNTQKGENLSLMKNFARMYDLVIERMTKPWLHFDCIYNLTASKREELVVRHAFRSTFGDIAKMGEATNDRKITLKVTEEHDGFIPSVLPICEKFAQSENLDQEDLIDNLLTLFAASEDTMTAIASAACVCFGMYPEYQDIAFNEVKAVVCDQTIDISYEMVTKLTYLDMCVKDVLRLFPIAPIIIRKTTEDFHIDNLHIPPECAILISIFNLHMDPNEWKEPMKFYPDHFQPDAIKNRHLFSYIPFSAGPRGCIGKTFAQTSIKLLLANILRKFRIEAEGNYSDIYNKLKSDISVRPTCGYPIKLHRRIWN